VSDPVCYSDVNSTRTLSSANWQWQGYPLTPEFCAWQCHQLNFSLAGTEYRTECYCGNALSGQSEVLTPDHCRMPCSGKANKTAAADETCGGDRAMSVYKVDCSGSAVPPPCWSNGTDGPPPPPDPTPIVALAWWQLQGGSAKFTPRTPPKTAVAINMTTSVAANALPVAVLENKLAAHGTAAHATIVLVDNEDGTYALQVGALYACATAPPSGESSGDDSGGVEGGGGGGDAELVLSAKTPTEACARFRVQVIKDTSKIASGDHFALRSAAVGLWVSVSACTVTHNASTSDTRGGGACPLTVATANPLMDERAAFTLTALAGGQSPPPH